MWKPASEREQILKSSNIPNILRGPDKSKPCGNLHQRESKFLNPVISLTYYEGQIDLNHVETSIREREQILKSSNIPNILRGPDKPKPCGNLHQRESNILNAVVSLTYYEGQINLNHVETSIRERATS